MFETIVALVVIFALISLVVYAFYNSVQRFEFTPENDDSEDVPSEEIN
jgi:type II secretory pathway component PulJ